MIEKEDVKLLKNELTSLYGHFEGEVAKKINVSKTSVIRFFNCGKVKSATGVLIYDAALELLQEGFTAREERKIKANMLLQKSREINSVNNIKK